MHILPIDPFIWCIVPILRSRKVEPPVVKWLLSPRSICHGRFVPIQLANRHRNLKGFTSLIVYLVDENQRISRQGSRACAF